MKMFIAVINFFACFLGLLSQAQGKEWSIQGLPNNRSWNIAHRGSSGMMPEHTVAAYQLAIDQGADVIECDVQVTKDLQLICSHDAWLNKTTDVHSKLEFRNRSHTYSFRGLTITDYFVIDFNLDELKTLRKVQDLPYRDQSYNGLFPIATFDEFVAVAQNTSNPRTIGIYPEIKIPLVYNFILASRSHNATVESIFLAAVEKHGYTKSSSPCFVQSFELNSLQYMSMKSPLPMMYLVAGNLSDANFSQIVKFCYAVIQRKDVVVETANNKIIRKTDFIARAHAHGLKVHVYTFQNEYMFLPKDYGSDPYREYEEFVNLEADGLITDYPWSLSNYFKLQESSCNGSSTVPCARVWVGMFVILMSFVARFLLS